MPIASVPGFLPTTSGLHFPNAWPEVPTFEIEIPHAGAIPIGDASRGLCGGMVFTVRDYFEIGTPPPTQTDLPAPDSELFRYIAERLLAADAGFLPGCDILT